MQRRRDLVQHCKLILAYKDVVLYAGAGEDTEGGFVEGVSLLELTLLFRTPETIRERINQYFSGLASLVSSVFSFRTHPEICAELDDAKKMVRYCTERQSHRLRAQNSAELQ